MSKEKVKKTRIVLDLTKNSVTRLDSLKEKVEAESRAAVIRQSLQLYEWFVNEIAEKNRRFFVSEEGSQEQMEIKIFSG